MQISERNAEASQNILRLLSEKIAIKSASKLSYKFHKSLPLICTPLGVLEESTRDEFEGVYESVRMFAEAVLSLLRKGESIDEKRDIQPLSAILLQSIVAQMLTSLSATIDFEQPFEVSISAGGTMTTVTGKFDKTIYFGGIRRCLLSFEDKNPAVPVDRHDCISQAVSQVISISHDVAAGYKIQFPHIVGYICNGLEFSKVEYGVVDEEERITVTPKELLIEKTSGGDFTINEVAISTVAKYLIHGVIITRNLYHSLRSMSVPFSNNVIEEERDEGLDDSGDGKREEKVTSDDIASSFQRMGLNARVNGNTGRQPINRGTNQRTRQSYFQPFLTEDLLFQHTLMTS